MEQVLTGRVFPPLNRYGRVLAEGSWGFDDLLIGSVGPAVAKALQDRSKFGISSMNFVALLFQSTGSFLLVCTVSGRNCSLLPHLTSYGKPLVEPYEGPDWIGTMIGADVAHSILTSNDVQVRQEKRLELLRSAGLDHTTVEDNRLAVLRDAGLSTNKIAERRESLLREHGLTDQLLAAQRQQVLEKHKLDDASIKEQRAAALKAGGFA